MKNYKKIISLALTAVMVLSVAGCQSKTGDNGKVQITVANCPNPEADPKGYENKVALKEAFEEQNPDIEIVLDEYAFSTETFYPKVEGGTLPNLLQIPITEAEKIVENEYSADITEYLKKYGIYDSIADFMIENTSKNGKVYLMPYSAYSLGLMLNLDLFEQAGLMEADKTPKAPKTFDELIEVSKTITEKTGKAGFVFPTTGNGGGWNFTALAWNFGVQFMRQNSDGKWEATFNSPECVEALQYLKDLKWKYNVLPASTLINNSETTKHLGTGQAAMMIAHPGQMDELTKSYGLSKDSIGFAGFPSGKTQGVTLLGGAHYMISKESTPEQIDAMFKWMEFTGTTPKLTESVKARLEDKMKLRAEQGLLVGISELSTWSGAAEVEKYKEELMSNYCNIEPNHVRLYNERDGVSYQVEEPVCAQDLYAILDKCIQAVLNDQNSDCKTILDNAAEEFQSNFLDYEN